MMQDELLIILKVLPALVHDGRQCLEGCHLPGGRNATKKEQGKCSLAILRIGECCLVHRLG